MILCKLFLIQSLLQHKGYLLLVICPCKTMCSMVSYNLHDLVLMPKGRLSPCGFWVQRIRATNLWNLFRGREGAEEHNGEDRWLVSLSKNWRRGRGRRGGGGKQACCIWDHGKCPHYGCDTTDHQWKMPGKECHKGVLEWSPKWSQHN